MTLAREASSQTDEVTSMRLRASNGEFFIVFLLVFASILLCGTALLRVPHSAFVVGLCALAVLTDAALVRWCLRSNGNIFISNDELIVKLRTGQTLRRNLHEIRSIQWNRVQRQLAKDRIGTESYVRIFTTSDIPLQFHWDDYRRQRRQSRAADLIGELRRRRPEVFAVESIAQPENIKVAHARRNSGSSHVFFILVAVMVCSFVGGVVHAIVPRSSGSAATLVKQLERSFSTTPSVSSDSKLNVGSEPCFIWRRQRSYWLEKVFQVEIRQVRFSLEVNGDPAKAEDDARHLLPNDWPVFGIGGLPDSMGRQRLYVQTPCVTARPGEFASSLERRFGAIMENVRVQVDQQR
jgi:hypothetical protein